MCACAEERALPLITHPNLLQGWVSRRAVSPLFKSPPAAAGAARTHVGRFENIAASLHYLCHTPRAVLPDNGGGNSHGSDSPKPWGLKILPPSYLFEIFEALGILGSYF